MKKALCFVADILDTVAAAAAVAALGFGIWAWHQQQDDPMLFYATAIACLFLAVIPYCVGAALHRIWERLD